MRPSDDPAAVARVLTLASPSWLDGESDEVLEELAAALPDHYQQRFLQLKADATRRHRAGDPLPGLVAIECVYREIGASRRRRGLKA